MSGPIGSHPPNGNGPVLKKKTVKDYQFGTRIGEGSYSTVFSALDVHSNKTYAIKVLSKRHIVKEDKIKYVNIEKSTLHRLGQQHPGIVQLYYTFQDESSLFFVLDFAEYGELLSIIRKFGSLSESVLKFYMSQILDAVSFIHLKGVIHRDLKPENILVGHDFNLKITDFGAAKLLGNTSDESGEKIDYKGINQESNNGHHDHDRRGSFVGTAEYVSPELLKHNLCGFESDVWALGCILYQFFHGNPPFKGSTEYLTFEKIINVEYKYRPNAVPPDVVTIIDQLLVAEPLQRLTIPQIMASRWFSDIHWADQTYIWGRKVPRIEPYNSENGTSSSLPTPSASPYIPAMKIGSNRNMNKSSSHQQLHSQIQQLDLNLIPSVGSKTYQPATKIKKNFMPPTSASAEVPLTPPLTNNYKSPASGQFSQRPMQKQRQNSAPVVPQMNNGMNNMARLNMANTPRTPEAEHGFPKPNPSPDANKGQRANLRSNTAFAGIPSSQQARNFHNRQYSTGSTQFYNKSNSQPGPLAYQGQQFAQAPNQQQQQQQQTTPQVSQPSYAAAAAANVSLRNNTSPTIPQINRNSPVERNSFQRPSPPVSRPRSPQQDSTKFVKKTSSTREPPSTMNGNSSTTSEKPSETYNDKSIKFREIHGLLEPTEKILKMDIILRLTLSNKEVKRDTSQLLDDSMIDDLITRFNNTLERTSVPVITVITNQARVFFIDGSLNVMMVDLKANQGGDYLMYDYEFESISVEDEDGSIEEGQDVYGYLILELIREKGDLIFLKRVSDMNSPLIKDTVKVLDKDGHEIKLGKNYGWIDCLLMAKEMVDTNKTSNRNGKTKKAPKQAQKVPGKKPKQKVPSSSSTRSETSSSVPKNANALSKLAYAAAAAAHK